jgi:four helix bundle protein
MSIIKSFRDLEAWKQGMDLVEHCYKVTRHFPVEERYVLTSQMRKAALSIPSNVAEGHCRRTTGAFATHVSIACGSEGELETCIEVAQRLRFLTAMQTADLLQRCTSVGKILTGLYSSLKLKLIAASQDPSVRHGRTRYRP